MTIFIYLFFCCNKNIKYNNVFILTENKGKKKVLTAFSFIILFFFYFYKYNVN